MKVCYLNLGNYKLVIHLGAYGPWFHNQLSYLGGGN